MGASFYCDYCGLLLLDDAASQVPAGWTDGAGDEVVVCPECREETKGICRLKSQLD